MKKEDIQEYLLSENEIKDIKLKEQVDNAIVIELNKLTPKIQIQKYNEYNIKDYSKLAESNKRRYILEQIQKQRLAAMSLWFIPTFGMGMFPIVDIIMNHLNKYNSNDFAISIITFVISLICGYFSFKNYKLNKLIENNLRGINNEE